MKNTKYVINTMEKKSKIDKNIYGHFSEHLGRCIYEGLFVGKDSHIPNVNGMRKDVVNALKHIKVPVLRWPGGCFADEYHWKDGIGENKDRKKMINTHWGGVIEDNSFGTHEFFELCEQIGCSPYICGNVGSGTVQEMSEWVEYMTFDGLSPMALLREKNGKKDPWKLKYFGVGNENWGCGGAMKAEFYADQYRRYQVYARNYSENKLYKIACGANGSDYNWTEVMMQKAFEWDYMNGLSLHYYTNLKQGLKNSATGFTSDEWYNTLHNTLFMDELLTRHCTIMDKYDFDKKVDLIVDEWGSWYAVEPGTNPGFLYQQNTMRDALIAAINLNIFNKHSDRVKMANIAQTVNVLQAVVLTENEKMVLTPTYHIFDLYKHHQDNELLGTFIESEQLNEGDFAVPNLHESASINQNGDVIITIANLSISESFDVDTTILFKDIKEIQADILTNSFDAYNTFENPSNVKINEYNEYKLNGNGLAFNIPACSVIRFIIK